MCRSDMCGQTVVGSSCCRNAHSTWTLSYDCDGSWVCVLDEGGAGAWHKVEHEQPHEDKWTQVHDSHHQRCGPCDQVAFAFTLQTRVTWNYNK